MKTPARLALVSVGMLAAAWVRAAEAPPPPPIAGPVGNGGNVVRVESEVHTEEHLPGGMVVTGNTEGQITRNVQGIIVVENGEDVPAAPGAPGAAAPGVAIPVAPPAPPPPNKLPMPKELTLPALDTKVLDDALPWLGLKEDQLASIKNLKKNISAESARLLKAQADARDACEKADTDEAYWPNVKKMLDAMQAIRAFDPQRRFTQGLYPLLTPAEWSQYQDKALEKQKAEKEKAQEQAPPASR